MINFYWRVDKLILAEEENDLIDVIKVIHWRYLGKNKTHAHKVEGELELEAPEEESFIDCRELVKDQQTLISWLENRLNVEEFKVEIENALEEKANPQNANQKVENNETQQETIDPTATSETEY